MKKELSEMVPVKQNYYEHIDGTFSDTGNNNLVLEMIRKGIIDSKSEDNNFGFCGIVYADEKIHFFWPKTSVLMNDDKEAFTYGRSLLGVLRKYSKSQRNEGSNYNRDDEVAGIPPIAALDILQDYISNGIYTNTKSEIIKRQSGNIDWNRVLGKSTPFPDKKGCPVYVDLYVRKPDYFAENEVSRIHAAIVAELDCIFGWYFTDEGSVAPRLANARMPCTEAKAISLLRRELSTLFSDREVRLLKNLIAILERKSTSDTNSFMFTGVRNFEHVWEEMCGDVYQNQKSEFSGRIPTPAYIIDGKVQNSESNRQRMDIILREGNEIVVLDAKYYDISVTKPQWGDLVKQFYYARSLSAIFTDCKITNYFLCPLPSVEIRELPDKAIILNPFDSTRMDGEFAPIAIRYHDVREIMSCYLGKNSAPDYRAEVIGAA